MQRRRVMLAGGKQSRLPKELQEVEWLESDGTAYIDSGIECTGNLRVAFRFMPFDNVNMAVCGGIAANSRGYFRHHCTPISDVSGLYYLRNGSDVYPNIVTVFANNDYCDVDIDPKSGIAVVNGQIINFGVIYDVDTVTTGKNYGIFARIGGGSIPLQGKKSRFCSFMFYRPNLIGEFVTCYAKASGEAGMYDMVAKLFHGNAGTGEFLVGPDVN